MRVTCLAEMFFSGGDHHVALPDIDGGGEGAGHRQRRGVGGQRLIERERVFQQAFGAFAFAFDAHVGDADLVERGKAFALVLRQTIELEACGDAGARCEVERLERIVLRRRQPIERQPAEQRQAHGCGAHADELAHMAVGVKPVGVEAGPVRHATQTL